MAEEQATLDTKLFIRYSVLSDDTSGELKDIRRMAEFVCSLISLKLYLLPYVNAEIVLYTLKHFWPRIKKILEVLDIPDVNFIFLDREEDIAFANRIKNCNFVDRICIRRMLADFRELPVDSFRLLIGNDCYFFRPPQEVISYTWNQNPQDKVLYMVDNTTFKGKPYVLRYYRPPILKGLLGDFYCLAPGVSLEREAITYCLQLIDEWPLYKRWKPDLPKAYVTVVHGCEQQAAAMLLGQLPARALPSSHYNNFIPKPNCVLLHSHWLEMGLLEMPSELATSVLNTWKELGYQLLLDHIEQNPPVLQPLATLKRQLVRQFTQAEMG